MPDDLVPQIEDAKRLCRLLGLAVLEEAGFEADDLIGSIAVVAREAGFRAEICSADKDLFQLVKDPDVAVFHPVKDVLLDEAGVLEFFGVKPSQVIDVLALMGDSSDNIPGVKGIGEKTAKELIATFGSLDAIYARLDEVKGKRKELLAGGRDEAYRSQTLATVRCDRPLPAPPEKLLEHFRIRPVEGQAAKDLAAFYDEMGFGRFKKELLESATHRDNGQRRDGDRIQRAHDPLSIRRIFLFLFESPSGARALDFGRRRLRRARCRGGEGRPRVRPRRVRPRRAVAGAAARGGRRDPGRRGCRVRPRRGRARRRSRRSSRGSPSSRTTPSASFSRPTRSGSRRPRVSSTRCSRATSWRRGSTRTTSRATPAAS